MQNQSPKPIVIEVDIKKSPAKDVPIKLRLEAQNIELAAPTLEEINKKLQKAEELRLNNLKKDNQIQQKVTKVLEKKVELE